MSDNKSSEIQKSMTQSDANASTGGGEPSRPSRRGLFSSIGASAAAAALVNPGKIFAATTPPIPSIRIAVTPMPTIIASAARSKRATRRRFLPPPRMVPRRPTLVRSLPKGMRANLLGTKIRLAMARRRPSLRPIRRHRHDVVRRLADHAGAADADAAQHAGSRPRRERRSGGGQRRPGFGDGCARRRGRPARVADMALRRPIPDTGR